MRLMSFWQKLRGPDSGVCPELADPLDSVVHGIDHVFSFGGLGLSWCEFLEG